MHVHARDSQRCDTFYNMPASFPRFALLPSLQQPATRGTADDARAQTLSCRRNVSVLRPRDTRPDADRAVVRCTQGRGNTVTLTSSIQYHRGLHVGRM
eukprot:m.217189 g.217189  ORF g.217189 m.217189 type:complete len:98 (+) comp19115_c0_seq57:3144-3437(+)